MANDVIISVTPEIVLWDSEGIRVVRVIISGGTGLVGMAELVCPSTWEVKDIVVCGSEGKRVDEDNMSGTLGDMGVLRILKGASVIRVVSNEVGVSC